MKRNKWHSGIWDNPEAVRFLKRFCKRRPTTELTCLFNEKFPLQNGEKWTNSMISAKINRQGWGKTKEQAWNTRKRREIIKHKVNPKRKIVSLRWTDEQINFLKIFYTKRDKLELARIMELKFPNYIWTEQKIESRLNLLGWTRTYEQLLYIRRRLIKKGRIVCPSKYKEGEIFKNEGVGYTIKVGKKHLPYYTYILNQAGIVIEPGDRPFLKETSKHKKPEDLTVEDLEVHHNSYAMAKSSHEINDKIAAHWGAKGNKEERAIILENPVLLELHRKIIEAKRILKQVEYASKRKPKTAGNRKTGK